MIRLNIGPGPHYVDGWKNVEVEQVRGIFEADFYVEDPMSLPFDDEYADLIYCGHILEHIEWEKVPTYIDELYRVLKPGGTLLIVGPDMIRGLELWKQGRIKRDFSENDPGLLGMLEWESLPNWDAPRHFWNCHEKRVISLLDPEYWFIESVPAMNDPKLNGWPIVSQAGWQMAVFATKK